MRKRRVFLLVLPRCARFSGWWRAEWPVLAFLILMAAVYRGPGASQQVDVTVPGERTSPSTVVTGVVGNVFGDPIPGAKVRFTGQEATAGERGQFALALPAPGPVQFTASAAGYRDRTHSINLEPGSNLLDLTYERGLWPEAFAVDFHVLRNEDTVGQLYGQIGIANGSEESVFLVGLMVLDAEDRVVANLLETSTDYRNFAGSYGDANFVAAPRLAVILRPRSIYRHDLQTLDTSSDESSYRLVVELADNHDDFLGGRLRRVEATAVSQRDDDWNPHTP